MSEPKAHHSIDAGGVLADLNQHLAAAADTARSFVVLATEQVRKLVSIGGDRKLNSEAMHLHQRALHGLAWYATYASALTELSVNFAKSEARGGASELHKLLAQAGAAELLAQMQGGLPISQVEIVRPTDLGIAAAAGLFSDASTTPLMMFGNTAAVRKSICDLIGAELPGGPYGAGVLDPTLEEFRAQMRRFCEAQVIPNAHKWHLSNAYIPFEVIEKMGELGVFGLTIPEEYGGLGLGKVSMCVVTEELSRGYIGVGSLGTRSEIAAELIMTGGTDAQKRKWLPRIASGEVLPTAVFTEPDTGSDLASLKTRAVRNGAGYQVTGQKTWITHPVRADLMTILARTDSAEPGYRGLSMFLAEKPRGTEEAPFPVQGLTGSEIGVLGYRGMKEFVLSFDGFQVGPESLLGGIEGEGFKQLMQTFESARIQTAARAVGVAQCALDLGIAYAKERKQFGRPIIAFPRVSDKLAMMAIELAIARELTYFAAREKDAGRRCDLEAGMAKLLGARVAWAAADNALQIHGGNGFALEFPISRVLCDARILNIFEGAAEIQAHVIARRLLEG
jgi:(2S)-methylsuccinyl-CoA dehydrogenase